jgi:hypothetical protein
MAGIDYGVFGPGNQGLMKDLEGFGNAGKDLKEKS